MVILGLNFLHANAAAALFLDGKVVAAAEEERFNRVKFSAGLPVESIRFCLKQAGIDFHDVDVISYGRNTNTRIVDQDQLHYQDRIYRIDSLYDRYRMNLKLINFKETLAAEFGIPVETLVFKLRETDHHRSHIQSGFHYSPFDQALLLSCDAFGDFVTIRTGVGEGSKIRVLTETRFPHSIGLFYTMVCQFLGFSEYGDESKVMGLSTFGYPEFTAILRRILSPESGTFRLNLDYFETRRGIGTTWSESAPDIGRVFTENLVSLLGEPRKRDEALTARHQNLAASLQHLTEEIISGILEDLCQQHPSRNLVFTGGLAYNSLLNRHILSQTEVENLFVPPAPGNSGLAIGSALEYLGPRAAPREMGLGANLGPSFDTRQVATVLAKAGLQFKTESDPASRAARLLSQGLTVGWFQGRMEFGPRTLGNRCILVNPSCADPIRIKRRDYLKPFGIAILEEDAQEYLLDASPSPFMSFMGLIRARHRQLFEGVLLNNYCRYQTVSKENARFYSLLVNFRKQTGQPFLINTSLNSEGTPIIASPQDLVKSLDDLSLDALLAEDLYVKAPRLKSSISESLENQEAQER